MNNNSLLRRQLLIAASFIAMIATTVSCVAGEPPLSKIVVTGEGSVGLAPDMAVVTMTVSREADTARKALDMNNEAMRELLEAMGDAGIKDKDLQTSGFSIQPRYVYPGTEPGGERKPPKIVAYIVRNSLTARIRDINEVGAVLDSSVSLGVNEGGDIHFTNADPSKAISQARSLAVKDAVTRAETLAEAADVDVGPILEISEQSYTPRPVPLARGKMSMAMEADSVPLASGENTYRVSVNMTFAIEQ